MIAIDQEPWGIRRLHDLVAENRENTEPAQAAFADAHVPAGSWHEEFETPFRTAIGAGTQAIMLGPSNIPELDPAQPASTSPAVIRRLRDELVFTGVIVTDELVRTAETDARFADRLHDAALRMSALRSSVS